MRAAAISFVLLAVGPSTGAAAERPTIRPAQFTPLQFNSWRPYKNPDRLVQVGMTKGQVLAIAGKPDYDDSYYQGAGDALSRTSDWYYAKPGPNGETAELKFVGDTLARISVTPVQ